MKGIQILLMGVITFLFSCKKDDCVQKEIENCNVTFEYNPVCGCNGVTYDNPSLAECNNITDYRAGKCD